MNAASWVFLGALLVVSVLLTVVIGAYAELAAYCRALRRENKKLRHPATRLLPGDSPIFDLTLTEIRSLPESTPGGAA